MLNMCARKQQQGREKMTLECINPRDLPTPTTYTQVVVAKGTKLIFVAGQERKTSTGSLWARVI